MPKCSVRPYGPPCHIGVWRLAGQEGRLALHRGEVGLGQVGRAAPQLRQHRRERGQHVARGLAGGDALRVGRELRQRVRPPRGERVRGHPGEERGPFGRLLFPALELLVPRRVQGLAALGDLARPGERLLLDREVHRRVEPEDLLGRGDLVGAEGGAVRGAGVLLGRRGPADDRVQHDERRLVGDGLGRLERVVERLHVLVVAAVGGVPVHVLHVPAVGLVAGADVLGLGDAGVVLDRDVVVVVHHDQVAELLHGGDRGGLVGDALFDVAVGAERVDEVVERRLAGGGVGVEQPALAAGGHRHADRVADALAERPGGDLHARGQAVLRVAGGDRAPGAQRLQVVQAQRVAGQVKLDVQRQRRMPAGQDKPVAARPLRVGRVVPQDPLVQQVGGGREGHRGPRVPVPDLLHGVHREDAD